MKPNDELLSKYILIPRTKQNVNDLKILLHHTFCDIDYGDGGSYTKMNGDLHRTHIKSVRHIIEVIYKGIEDK